MMCEVVALWVSVVRATRLPPEVARLESDPSVRSVALAVCG